MDSTDRSHNDDFTIYSIYSCLGIYEISTGLNYEKAIAHFLNGMRTALSHGDYSNYQISHGPLSCAGTPQDCGTPRRSTDWGQDWMTRISST